MKINSINSINSINDIQKLVVLGFHEWKLFGNVNTKKQGDLTLFNYSAQAIYSEEWNFFELVSRGLILNNKTGEVVARPFDKFFNYGQGGRYPSTPIKTVTEKMDGSLGILYHHDREWKIATRGSFDSDQAIWATEFLKQYDMSILNPQSLITLLFEIIYPDNRVVVDYKGREDLVLIGARNCFTGDFYSYRQLVVLAQRFGFSLPGTKQFDNPEDIVAACKELHGNAEGWVAEFEGERFKFKGEQYMELHRLITGLSFKAVLGHVKDGTLDTMLAQIPDEFLWQARQWADEINEVVTDTMVEVELVFRLLPTGSRKEFALAVKDYKRAAPYLFARLDGKPIKPLIYKLAFKKGE